VRGLVFELASVSMLMNNGGCGEVINQAGIIILSLRTSSSVRIERIHSACPTLRPLECWPGENV
jgi:hypothetical protein